MWVLAELNKSVGVVVEKWIPEKNDSHNTDMKSDRKATIVTTIPRNLHLE